MSERCDAIMVQTGTAWCAQQLRTAAPYHAKYCAHHGMEYRPDFERRHPEKSKYFERYERLIEALEDLYDGDLAVYLDCDTIIVKPQMDFREALPRAAEDIAMVEYGKPGAPRPLWNTGMMLVRNCFMIREFFREMLAAGPLNYKTLREDEGRIHKMLEEQTAIKVRTLPYEWNHSLYTTVTTPTIGNSIAMAWHGTRTSMLPQRMHEAARAANLEAPIK